MDQGMSYASVEDAVPESVNIVSDPPREMTMDLAREHVAALDALPRPTLVTCRAGPRSSAVVYLYSGLKAGAAADEVIARAEADDAPFVQSDELKAWVAQGLDELSGGMTPDPGHIMQVGMGFMGSKTLLSAVELELFTQLGGDALTAPSCARSSASTRARSPTSRTRWSRSGCSIATARGATRATATRRTRAVFLDKAEPGLHRRNPRDVERPALPVLGRSDRWPADRQAAERGQARRQGDVRGAVQRSRSARAVHERDGRDLDGAVPSPSRRRSTSRATRRCATSAARPGSCRSSSPAATPTCAARASTCPSSSRSRSARSKRRG